MCWSKGAVYFLLMSMIYIFSIEGTEGMGVRYCKKTEKENVIQRERQICVRHLDNTDNKN